MSETASANGRGTPGADTALPADAEAAEAGNRRAGNGAGPAPVGPRHTGPPEGQATGRHDTTSPHGRHIASLDGHSTDKRGNAPPNGRGPTAPNGQDIESPDAQGTTSPGAQGITSPGAPGTGATSEPATEPAVSLEAATLAFGDRVLWRELDLSVARGEFIAVLGPNGSGKTSLLRVLLGQLTLSAGRARIGGAEPRAGHPDIGYIPQQRTIDAGVQLRGTDLVGLGVDGHRWGLGLRGRAERRRKVAAAIADVGAGKFARAPLESMSGGEQQRLRVAQALVGDPAVLLCDEPLLSLDLASQQLVSGLIDRRRREHGTAVLFVTHEINPILPLVDRVLYLVDGKFRIGTPDEVMTSAVLSELYQTDVDVLRVRGRLVVVGTGDTMDALGTAGAHCHGDPGTPHTPDPAGTDTVRQLRQAHT